LEAKGEGEAVARLLNHAVDLPNADFAAAIQDRREASDPVSYVTPPTNQEEDRILRRTWAERTGEELNDGEVAQVGQAGTEETIPVSWSSLQKALHDLQGIRDEWNPEPGPWLFTARPLRPFVTPQDFEIVRKLEAEAEAIDELDAEAEVGQEPHELITMRRAFLAACREAGLFRMEHDEVIEQWLQNWSALRLLSLRRAVNQIRSWGFLKDNEEPPDGRICLDYVRLELWPKGEDGKIWAGTGVALLAPAVSGDQGAVVENVGNSTIRMWWRCDGELPGLLAIARS
jgi:hypothetical protein